MARYKPVDRGARLLPAVSSEQLLPGSFEFALDHLVDHELDLSPLDVRICNGAAGAPACDRLGLIGKSVRHRRCQLPGNARKERSGTQAELLHRAQRTRDFAIRSSPP